MNKEKLKELREHYSKKYMEDFNNPNPPPVKTFEEWLLFMLDLVEGEYVAYVSARHREDMRDIYE